MNRYSQVTQLLMRDLPPVTLLLGGQLVFLGMVIGELSAHYEIGLADTVWLRSPVTADAARSLVREAGIAPFGAVKLAIVLLDGASEQAQNILLKCLEEPPPYLRFLLAATEPPLPTILSRSRVFRFGAEEHADEPDTDAQARVTAAIRAAASGDKALMLSLCQGFDSACLSLLEDWAVQQARGYRPEIFGAGPPEPRVPARTARKVLAALSVVGRARPVNAATAALSEAFD